MLELLTGFVALAAFLAISYFRGRSKKESALATALSSPSEVARLYLRHSPEMNAHWLHVQFRNGRKRVIAAPGNSTTSWPGSKRRGSDSTRQIGTCWRRSNAPRRPRAGRAKPAATLRRREHRCVQAPEPRLRSSGPC